MFLLIVPGITHVTAIQISTKMILGCFMRTLLTCFLRFMVIHAKLYANSCAYLMEIRSIHIKRMTDKFLSFMTKGFAKMYTLQ